MWKCQYCKRMFHTNDVYKKHLAVKHFPNGFVLPPQNLEVN